MTLWFQRCVRFSLHVRSCFLVGFDVASILKSCRDLLILGATSLLSATDDEKKNRDPASFEKATEVQSKVKASHDLLKDARFAFKQYNIGQQQAKKAATAKASPKKPPAKRVKTGES